MTNFKQEIAKQIAKATNLDEKELEYISNCKNLIKIFERKIKDKLSEVWGE